MQHFNSAVEWNTSISYTFWLLLLPGVLLCRVVTSSAPLMPELCIPGVIEVTCSFPSRWFVLLVGLHNENKTKKNLNGLHQNAQHVSGDVKRNNRNSLCSKRGKMWIALNRLTGSFPVFSQISLSFVHLELNRRRWAVYESLQFVWRPALAWMHSVTVHPLMVTRRDSPSAQASHILNAGS